MKKILILLFLFAPCLFSQAQIYQFQKTYGSGNRYRGNAIKATIDGGYLIAGSSADTVTGTYHDVVIKTDAAGTIQWEKNYSDGGEDWIYSIALTNDGGYIFAGSSDASPFFPYSEIYIIKTNASGNLQWAKTIADSTASGAFAIKQTSDGNYIITGFASDPITGSKVIILKMSGNGTMLWANKYGGPVQSKEFGMDILEANNGNYVAVGTTATYGSGNVDIYLIETDTNGNLLWTKTFGGILDDYGYALSKVNNENGFFIAGSAASFSSNQDDQFFLLKTDATGNLVWSKTYSEAGQYGDGYGLFQNANNNLFIYGTQLNISNGHEKSLLLKTDPSGNMLWSREYDYSSYNDGAKVIPTSFNGLALLASCGQQFYNGEILLIKTDSLGNSGCSEMTPVIS
ncbi:MAG TPA: hypothetical protein VFJ43_09055, partial [Bacteroidia bacterium]|nr:hypothetical protein [Bacteroidia bacterium]